MIDAARRLAAASDAEAFAAKIQNAPARESGDRVAFLAEVDGLRREVAEAAPLHASEAVAAAHRRIRKSIRFLDRDRALDGEVAAIVRMVADDSILSAARAALSG
jgi:histidine ammonia-lyase